MNEFAYFDPRREAELISRADRMHAVAGMAITGMWDPAGCTKDKIRVMALEAANSPRVEASMDEKGCPMYGAWLENMTLPSTDMRRGRLALRFQGEGFSFSGIGVDLSEFGRGQYHLYPDGRLATMRNDEEKTVGPLRGRLLFEQMRNYCVTFTDPRLLKRIIVGE